MISRIDIEDMTDAQDEAPKRIWADRSPFGEHSWMDVEYDGGTPYVRADLARPSQAGDETVAYLMQAAREMIEGYDWWKVDTYDRCQSVLEDCIGDLRAALAAMDTPKEPTP